MPTLASRRHSVMRCRSRAAAPVRHRHPHVFLRFATQGPLRLPRMMRSHWIISDVEAPMADSDNFMVVEKTKMAKHQTLALSGIGTPGSKTAVRCALTLDGYGVADELVGV